MIVSCGFLEDELRQCSKEEGLTMADTMETPGADLRTRVKRLKELHEGGGQEVGTSGHGASENVARTGSGNSAHRKI